MTGLARLRDFVLDFTVLVETSGEEALLMSAGREKLAKLVAVNDWLPASYALAGPTGYRQYLLHCDVFERFSVVSFVWGPGQSTPIHDHRGWGLIGVLQGAEEERSFSRLADGSMAATAARRLEAGQVTAVSPSIGDIHQVSNALADQVSISIHVYSGNIGARLRATYDPETGAERHFISGYSNGEVPNLWDRSGPMPR